MFGSGFFVDLSWRMLRVRSCVDLGPLQEFFFSSSIVLVR